MNLSVIYWMLLVITILQNSNTNAQNNQLEFDQCDSNSNTNAITKATWMSNFDNPFSSIITYKFTKDASDLLTYSDTLRLVVPIQSLSNNSSNNNSAQPMIDRSYSLCGTNAAAKQKCLNSIIQRRELSGQMNMPVPFDQSAVQAKIYVLNKVEQRNIFELCVKNQPV